MSEPGTDPSDTDKAQPQIQPGTPADDPSSNTERPRDEPDVAEDPEQPD